MRHIAGIPYCLQAMAMAPGLLQAHTGAPIVRGDFSTYAPSFN